MNDKKILDIVNQAHDAIDEALNEIMVPELREHYEIGKLGRAGGLLHEFKKSIYARNPDLRPPPPWSGEEELRLTDAECAEIDKLSPEQLISIDEALLELTTKNFQKVARVVGDFMANSSLHSPKIPDIFYTQRIASLVTRGLLVHQGNLKFMRFSEIKKTRNHMSKTSPPTVEDLKSSLTLTVGNNNIIFADDDVGNRLQPYLEESRGRQVGTAFAIVFPSTTEELTKVVGTCRFHKVPIVPQGGNTGRCFGAQTDDARAVIINLKNLNRIIDIDTNNMTVTAQAGVTLLDLQKAVADAGCFFPLSLPSEADCQVGGNLATNAGGINVVRYGNTRDVTLGVEAVLANGTVLNSLYGLRKDNTGYDLKNLLIGSEGTLGIITAATLKIFPPERNNAQGFIAVASIDDAVKCLRELQSRFTDKVSTFELIPQFAIELLEQHSDLRCPVSNQHPWYVWYKIADSQAENTLLQGNDEFIKHMQEDGKIIEGIVANDTVLQDKLKDIRKTTVAVQKYAGVSIKNDVSVPISSLSKLIEAGNKVLKQICPDVRPYTFGHVGDGNIHYNLIRPENMSDEAFMTQYKDKLESALLDIVDGLDGSFAAEHGVGSMKVSQMQHYKDPVALDMMRRIKHAFDPFNLMNPGKVVPLSNKKDEPI